jgi:hypothetical protein
LAAHDVTTSFGALSRELVEEAWNDSGDLFDEARAELRERSPEPAPSTDMAAVLLVLGALALGVVEL